MAATLSTPTLAAQGMARLAGRMGEPQGGDEIQLPGLPRGRGERLVRGPVSAHRIASATNGVNTMKYDLFTRVLHLFVAAGVTSQMLTSLVMVTPKPGRRPNLWYEAHEAIGIGLLLALFLAGTGTVLAIGMASDGGLSMPLHAIKELHETAGPLMWAHLIAHSLLGLLHQLAGHGSLSRMFGFR